MSKGEKKESELTNFYYNNKILIWILIFILLFIVIMKFVVNKDNTNIKPIDKVIVISIEPKDSQTVGIGNTIELKANINVSDAKIIWTTSDPSIAKVDNGHVTGINTGTVEITALYVDGDNKYSAVRNVTVVEGNPNVYLERVSFREGDLYMPLNTEYQLDLILKPSDASINNKVFVSSDDNIASVSNNGLVKSNKVGHAKILATINDNYKTSIDVYVGDYSKSEIVVTPTTLSFNSSTRKIRVGDTEKLAYSVFPSNADNSKITWKSSNESIVTVDQNGRITAKGEGSAIVSIASANGQKDSIIVEVYQDIVDVKDIIIDTNTLNMEAGKTTVITPTVSPSNASNKELQFISSDSSVVSVSTSTTSTSATLSALKAGSAIITIKSGNVEKQITVNVTGTGNNSNIDEDDPSLPTTIQVRSNKNNLAKSYDEVVKIPVLGTAAVSITMSMGVGSVKYCVNKYTSKACTPNIEIFSNDTVIIPSNDIYVLRVIKYDYHGVEIESKSANYVDGVLNYYINTKSSSNTKKYTVTGAYENSSSAMIYPNNIGDKVTVSLDDSSRHLNICYSTSSTCTPNTTVRSSYTININKNGLWRIFVDEYDASNKKIGNTETYYVYVEESVLPTLVPTISTNGLKASNLKILSNNSGKYLVVVVEGDDKFNNVRFCYKVVNKNSAGTCNLDVITNNVTYYNNGTIVKPKEELKTYYATMSSTNKYSFKFYLDALDELYDTSNTNKAIIFEFAPKTSKGFTNPIKVRINMTKKTGNDATWNVGFIK